MTNYKGVFKQIDLKKIDHYDIKKDKESFIINLNNIFHIEFVEFEILNMFDIKIYFSVDKATWIEFKKEECLLINANKYSLTCSDREKYQYIKINTKLNNIKNKKINIFVRKFPGLMVAARSDGFGARLMPILNAMYLAEYTGFKFGFVWKRNDRDTILSDGNQHQEVAKTHLLGESDIFSSDFIKQYSYTDKLGVCIRTKTSVAIEDWMNELSCVWGEYVNYDTARRIFGTKPIRHYPKLWKKIKFSDYIQKAIDKANNIVKINFPNKFIAIHIRSGDIVYDERIKKLGVGFGKAMPLEIAIELIEENLNKNEKIVLFGDDFTSLRELKNQYNINIIEDYIDEQFTNIQRMLFEIVFMSNAKDIFSGHSSFSRVASYIGLGREPSFYFHIFNTNQQLKILQKHTLSCFSNLQKAHSLYHSAMLHITTKTNFSSAITFLEKASKIDRNNCLYILLMLFVYLKIFAFEKAEKILSESFFTYEDFIENLQCGILCLEIKKEIAKLRKIEHFTKLSDFASNIKKYFEQNFEQIEKEIVNDLIDELKLLNQNINDKNKEYAILKLEFQEQSEEKCLLKKDLFKTQDLYNFFARYGSAKARIQNQLSYKLGQAMIVNSKSILGYIRMPFVLSYIKDKHKQEQKNYQEKIKKNPSLKLPPLEDYPDYQEALKEKECLTYKLGQALIQANKNWYGGGYIKLLFSIKKLISQFSKFTLINYKGVFKQIDLKKIDHYDIKKDKESFIINLNNIFHIEFVEFEILNMFDIKIYFSVDKATWIEFKKEECLLINANKYSLTCSDREKYQYIKINTKLNNIKNKKINIFVRKFPGLMVAARSDGFGARLMPILNAMYLAEYTGFKFGFVWKRNDRDTILSDGNQHQEVAKTHLLGESDIFSSDFIKQYSYTDKLGENRGLLVKKELCQITNNLCFENTWGWFVSQSTPQLIFDCNKDNFARHYPKLWKKIKFSDYIQKAIDKANNIVKINFPNKFIAIHIRSGDIVYDERVYLQGKEWLKAMPLEIAIELIEENLNKNEKIVLFGDDFTSLRELKNQYNINIIEDYIDEQFTNIQRMLFEIVFMSNAKDIFSGHSSFSRVASYIGLGREPSFYYKYYSRYKMYNIVKQKIQCHTMHSLQKSFSYYFLFRLGYALERKQTELFQWIFNAWNCNQNNDLYRIGLVLLGVLCNKHQQVEKILSQKFISDNFWNNYYKKSFFREIFLEKINVQKNNQNTFPNICNVIKKMV